MTRQFESPKDKFCSNCFKANIEIQKLQQQMIRFKNKLTEKSKEIRKLQRMNKYLNTFKPLTALQTRDCAVCWEKLTPERIYTHLCTPNGISCEYCSQRFGVTTKLLEHLEIYHDNKEFHDCDRCLQKFGMSELLNIHRKVHPMAEPSYACVHCGQKFYLKTRFNDHMKAKHPDKHLTPNPILKRE